MDKRLKIRVLKDIYHAYQILGEGTEAEVLEVYLDGSPKKIRIFKSPKRLECIQPSIIEAPIVFKEGEHFSRIVGKNKGEAMGMTKKEREYLQEILQDIEENKEWYAAMSEIE